MAVTAAATITRVDTKLNTYDVYFTLALTGSYVTGGFTLDLTQAAGLKLPVNTPPIFNDYMTANGYMYPYISGSNAANGTIKILTTASTELSAGALPAGVTGDTIIMLATFSK